MSTTPREDEKLALDLLRQVSDCPLMTCRRAYQRTSGDLTAATDLLRLWSRGVKVPATNSEIRRLYRRSALPSLQAKLSGEEVVSLVRVLREIQALEEFTG